MTQDGSEADQREVRKAFCRYWSLIAQPAAFDPSGLYDASTVRRLIEGTFFVACQGPAAVIALCDEIEAMDGDWPVKHEGGSCSY
jgi:hypothetical protein